jgi:hypothetical protein
MTRMVDKIAFLMHTLPPVSGTPFVGGGFRCSIRCVLGQVSAGENGRNRPWILLVRRCLPCSSSSSGTGLPFSFDEPFAFYSD